MVNLEANRFLDLLYELDYFEKAPMKINKFSILKTVYIYSILLTSLQTMADTDKNLSILIMAPDLHGKLFFSTLINSPDNKEAPKFYLSLNENNPEFPQNLRRLSVSSHFSKSQFEFIATKARENENMKRIRFLDLSLHPHGFVNNMSMTWIESEISNSKIQKSFVDEEKSLLEILKKNKTVSVYTLSSEKLSSLSAACCTTTDLKNLGTKRTQVQIEQIQTSFQFLLDSQKKIKTSYYRLPIKSDSLEDAQILSLIEWFKANKDSDWLHIYHEEPKPIYKNIILIIDLLSNAKSEELEDIKKRNTETTLPQEKIESLYNYSKEQAPHFKKSWSL